MLLRLIYASRPATDDLDGTLDAIQAEAIPKNRARDITGVLVADSGWLMHALEGPDAAVREVFRQIEADPRHRSVVKLSEEPIEARLFGAWSLGCRVVSARDAAALRAIDRRPAFDPATAPKRVLMRCLTVIAEAHRDKFDRQQRRIAA